MGMLSINLAVLLFLVIAAWAYLFYECSRNEEKAKNAEKKEPKKDKE